MKYALGLAVSAVAAVTPCALGCGGDDPVRPLFEPQPECEGDPIVAFAGVHPNVISMIEIGDLADGFDLDGDGKPDNKLAAVGSLARTPIEEALRDYDLIIPFEFFDLAGAAEDACVKFAIYLGVYKKDADGDGRNTVIGGGDCNDHDANIRPGATEIVGNFVDDDCDGLADEIEDGEGGQVASDDVLDRDGDGVTLADGDCDDSVETGEWSRPGLAEICGDGRDNDCDGVADNGDACNPYLNPNTIDVDPLSFAAGGAPLIMFTNGAITRVTETVGTEQVTKLQLSAGPSIFSVNIPVIDGISLDLRITGAQILADVVMDGDTIRIENGRLGGVIDAQTADGIRGLDFSDINLTPENSLLDAVFANILGTLLALPTAPAESGYGRCRTPDIDVDRDGLEIFCDTTDDKSVDLCIDGDGTEIRDEVVDGVVVKQCTEALNADGTRRFVDGISVELNFATTPTLLRAP